MNGFDYAMFVIKKVGIMVGVLLFMAILTIKVLLSMIGG